jgi:hypothetical protein
VYIMDASSLMLVTRQNICLLSIDIQTLIFPRSGAGVSARKTGCTSTAIGGGSSRNVLSMRTPSTAPDWDRIGETDHTAVHTGAKICKPNLDTVTVTQPHTHGTLSLSLSPCFILPVRPNWVVTGCTHLEVAAQEPGGFPDQPTHPHSRHLLRRVERVYCTTVLVQILYDI